MEDRKRNPPLTPNRHHLKKKNKENTKNQFSDYTYTPEEEV